MASVIAAGEASITLRSSTAGLPPLQFLGRLPLVAAEFGDERDHAGVDAGHHPVGFLPLAAARQQPAGTPGQIGHVRTPLIQDPVVEAGAQAVPALFERGDARVAAGDFKGVRARREGLPAFADSGAKVSISQVFLELRKGRHSHPRRIDPMRRSGAFISSDLYSSCTQ
jgi:hypothetical protein